MGNAMNKPESLEHAPGVAELLALDNPALYINRELSLIQFNWRVLNQALDESLPLFERLKFLFISASNLDEFFEVRVADLVEQTIYEADNRGPDGLTPAEALAEIAKAAHHIVDEQYRILNEVMFPRLEAERVRFVRRRNWTPEITAWIEELFLREVLPVVSPVALDPAHPFPRLVNKSLHFIVELDGKDAFGRQPGYGIVHVPRSLPRIIRLPKALCESCSDDGHHFVFLSSIIHAHTQELFPGMKINGCYQFRLTRDSDVWIDEERTEDIATALKKQLLSRPFGNAVRLEVSDACPAHVSEYLLQQFDLDERHLYAVNGPVNLTRLMAITQLIDRPELKFPPFTPGLPKRLRVKADIFDVVRQGDVLLNHPFEGFTPIIDFVRKAAADPHVLAIKQTLYRTGADSELVQALIDAARAGKEVTAVVELRARFDEQANLELASQLQEAGALVVYGVVGYKTHAKMILVVRREAEGLRRYVHLGTGNYHASTAKLYTDFGLLTCDPDIGEDVHKVFQQLTGTCKTLKLKKLWQSPFTLHKNLLTHIQKETEHAAAGRPGRIIARMNALTEEHVIRALYKASQAGVQIDLIVRGICALRPGVPGVSDHIRVRSVVGRFLEHPRIYYFFNDGEEKLVCASADWMDRNLNRRIEVAFPVDDKKLFERIKKEGLQLYLDDNCQSWELKSDGSYVKCAPDGQPELSAQRYLLERLAAG
ncbi:MAG: polyphosphate kinase 1 [Gammaproteobacteria bacterium]|nr:polyphosphate kinase 1 [Gammaproteobacteria bacterium]